MQVRDLMSRPITVPPDANMREVAHTMVRRGVSAVVVAGDDDIARGLITERDFAENGELPYSDHGTPTVLRRSLLGRDAIQAFEEARTTLAHRVMRPLDAVLEEEAPLEKALDLMLHRGKRNIVVLRDGRAVGLVCFRDLVRLAAGGTERNVPRLELV